MAKIKTRSSIAVQVTMVISEEELMALEALAGYGDKDFLEVFYKRLGERYLGQHEAGLKSLFAEVRRIASGVKERSRDARDVYAGIKVATERPKPINKNEEG